MALISLVHVLVLYEILALLVDAVVGEVSIHVLFDVVSVIRVTCKPHQTLVIDIYFQRVKASDKNIKPQIELQAIDQQRVVNVPTDNQ